MIVLDATVLVYAKGEDHPLREPWRALVAAIAADDVEATTTVGVVQEFVQTSARAGEAGQTLRGWDRTMPSCWRPC